MDFLRQHINNNDENNIGNIPSPENNNYINNKDNGNCCDKENMDKKKPKKKQIAEFTNIRDIPLHRVQFGKNKKKKKKKKNKFRCISK